MRRRISPASASIILLLNSSILLPVAGLHAQASSGKIQGRVLSGAGLPLASAQVTIDGTNLGNITNDEGYYFVNEVPAGLLTVRAQSIGYRTVATTGQRVLAGQTTTLNFALEQAAVELDPLVIVGERNPLVPRDQVASKSIVTGELIDELPLDEASSIVLLSPGVVETNRGMSIRGSREGEHAVYVDGVPVRTFRNGDQNWLRLPVNALAQVDVTTGGVSSRYANARSGLVNYVTRTGGPRLGGTVAFFSDELSPLRWRGGFNRGEFSAGGPGPVERLTWFLAGTAEGRNHYQLPQGFNGLARYVPSGIDTVIRLARDGTRDQGDSVDVVIPNYEIWDHGATSPSRVSSTYDLTTKVSYGLGAGSKLDLTYYGSRRQGLSRGWLSGPFNPDSWSGSYGTQGTLTLGGYFLLRQSAEQAIALDVKASYQRDRYQYGLVTQAYLNAHLMPTLGFNLRRPDFILEPADWPVNDLTIQAIRAQHLAAGERVLLHDMAVQTRQGIDGVADVLRLNPYALRSDFPFAGRPQDIQQWNRETRWYGTAALDWQTSRLNRLWVGGDLTLSRSTSRWVPLFHGSEAYETASLHSPVQAGAFVQDRLDLGDVVLEGGLRLDYFDADGEFPRVPGYTDNVPDSLTADRWTIAAGDAPTLQRLVPPTGDCGGAATAADRTNAHGEVVCLANFIPTRARTRLSPKLAASFPVTATSTFRLSYGHGTQPPTMAQLFTGVEYPGFGQGRDVEIPTTVTFEAGYRQVFGGHTVLDVALYSRTVRNALTFRQRPFNNPNDGSNEYIGVLENADFSLAQGADLVFRRRFSEAIDLTLNYSFLDARGTGSDPWDTFETLMRSTNVSVLTGKAADPPDVLRQVDQSRTHTLAGMLALRSGRGFLQGLAVPHAIFGDLSLFATLRVSSGLPYTRCVNRGAVEIGPSANCGDVIEAVNASRTPVEKRFDTRLTKGFAFLGRTARVFADFRNPLGLTNLDRVYMETGTATNPRHREEFVDARLMQLTWDGDVELDDFDIKKECEKTNPVNQYMVLQAERRFGDGDGIFTVAEQRRMVGDFYNLAYGPQTLRDTDRSLRLGFELVF